MFYTSGGARLFSVTLGVGPDVILLHPTPVHHGFWNPVALPLSDQYRITLPDLRGHGQSEAGHGVISMESLGQDVERLLDAAGIERAMFVGCSIGGYLLYEVWRRIPQRVRALAFCCGKPQPDTDASRARRRETIATIQTQGASGFFDQAIANLVGPAFRQREPAKVAELRAMMNAVTPEAAIGILRCLMERPDSVPILPGISVPVLALAASEDPASTPEEMKILSELIPGAEFHVLPGAGHYAPFEQPPVVGRILRGFLNRVSA